MKSSQQQAGIINVKQRYTRESVTATCGFYYVSKLPYFESIIDWPLHFASVDQLSIRASSVGFGFVELHWAGWSVYQTNSVGSNLRNNFCRVTSFWRFDFDLKMSLKRFETWITLMSFFCIGIYESTNWISLFLCFYNFGRSFFNYLQISQLILSIKAVIWTSFRVPIICKSKATIHYATNSFGIGLDSVLIAETILLRESVI